MPEIPTTTRAYTLKLSGNENWRELLWNTHLTANRGTQVWGDWLLTLRGGLPASLESDTSLIIPTDKDVVAERKRRKLGKEVTDETIRTDLEARRKRDVRVLLALSWLSVESPRSLAPQTHIVTTGKSGDKKSETDDRKQRIMSGFRKILNRLQVDSPEEWVAACEPALTSRIREDAVWVDRSAVFAELAPEHPGLSSEWAAGSLFELIGGAGEYFAMPDAESAAAAEAKDFVQKAGGWLSRNWGAGEKSDAAAISRSLLQLAEIEQSAIVGRSGAEALTALVQHLGGQAANGDDPAVLFKTLKQQIGWKGRSSKGAIALEKVRDAKSLTADLWEQVTAKLREEAAAQAGKGAASAERPAWMADVRSELETKIGMPYRTEKDLIWESAVMLDHALRRVSAAHTWIKRAEVSRRQFQEDAAKIDAVSAAARKWLDEFRAERSTADAALGEYIIRKHAIDGWDKIVKAWNALGSDATRQQRIDEARDVQRNLDDNEKFGDIQLFAGFGDDEDAPRACLADDAAVCVWRNDAGKADSSILKNYVAATVAAHDQQRFKVPAYRHPDPLRHPVYVDFGNSRWGITYSALKAAQDRRKLADQLARAKTENARARIQQRIQELDGDLNLRGVTLSVWTGEVVESLPLRWHGKRLWKDLNLDDFGQSLPSERVSRADRLSRAAAGVADADVAVTVAEVFDQKDWNGRLQVSREQLDRLADLIYGKDKDGKRRDPDYEKLLAFQPNESSDGDKACAQWARLNWFLSFSAKLRPDGPWLNYVDQGLPAGIEYRQGRSGAYLHYDANNDRKSRVRLQLARLPGLRVLSLDLGHRYAAACAVWETVSTEQMHAACRAAGHPLPQPDALYVHLQQDTDKLQKSGKRKGQPVSKTTIYRRIGADVLPDGTPHPAPWARLERQFLIKLQGEDRPARFATCKEWSDFDQFQKFLGLKQPTKGTPLERVPNSVNIRVNELQKQAVRLARLGLRRLADCARIAYILTATEKPVSGGRTVKLDGEKNREQRIEYVLDGLVSWQGLAKSTEYQDDWAAEQWQSYVVKKLGGPQPIELSEDARGSQRKKQINDSRARLRDVAEKLVDVDDPLNRKLHKLWTEKWERRQAQWRTHLRGLRKLILPRIGQRPSGNDAEAFQEWKAKAKSLRHTGGLSLQRLKTIRDLYQVLKAFHMCPEPDDLRKNIPELGDESLAKFGHRILRQLERMREQRIKQLASRIVEAALGVGSENPLHRNGRKRPAQRNDDPRFEPCHAVVVEDLERYRPEESRLRRENRQLMTWAARNVRKFIMEGCQLNGLHFVEAPPEFTSRQDSRTGAPGIRCEDIPADVFRAAAQACDAVERGQNADRRIKHFRQEIDKARKKLESGDASSRDRQLVSLADGAADFDQSISAVRRPRRGGEIFVSADPDSPAARGLQADLNAAANIGIKALLDPDWMGAWWYVLVESATGLPVAEKVKGSPLWADSEPLLEVAEPDEITAQTAAGSSKKRPKKGKANTKKAVYAWNPLHWAASNGESAESAWASTQEYWQAVESNVAEYLRQLHADEPTPF